MHLSQAHLQRIAELVLKKWKSSQVVTLKADEKVVLARAIKAMADDYQKEINLEKDVNKMLDDLERSNPGQFQRFKMYPMLKQKLAKEKKVIL